MADHERRIQQLLDGDTVPCLEKAVDEAHACLEVDKTHVRGYLLLTKALCRLRRHEDAVTWFKKGLELHPDNVELQRGLKEARVAVLNGLLEESEDEEEEEEEEPSKTNESMSEDDTEKDSVNSLRETQLAEGDVSFRSTEIVQRAQTYAISGLEKVLTDRDKTNSVQDGRGKQTTIFQAKMERVLEHLDVVKLARLSAMYIINELLNLRRVTFGIGLFFLGLLAQSVMHRQKIMVVSMLLICFYRSQLRERALSYVHEWVQTSTDKLGAFTWAPRIVFVIPVLMKVFGQLKFMLFLQQDVRLAGIVVGVTSVLVANSLRAGAGSQTKLWGEGRRLKFAAYFSSIVYWVGWRSQVSGTIRLLGPAFIDAAGIVLGSVSSSELQEVFRRALKRLYNDVADGIQADVELDAWFILGLANWTVEYWEQPTDFSLETLSKMLSECFDSMEKAATRTFNPELRHLREQLMDMQITDEMQLLVSYLKKSLADVPPSQAFGMSALFAKRCPSFAVFGLLVIFYGVISLPLLAFVVSEFPDARFVYDCYRDGKLHKMDGLELMLLGSPLSRVWKNVKASIYCLEGSVTFSKAVATGTHIVSAAARISELAVFASRVNKQGIFANAHDIPGHIANAFLVTKDSSLIIAGVRYIRDSAQFQDLTRSIAGWWYGGSTKDTSRSQQES